MARTLIDLSMPVHNEMITFPRVVRPALVMFETWQGFAERIGATKYGVDSLTAHYMVVIGDHIGTHMDSLRHMRENAPGLRLFRSNIAMGRAYAWTSVIFRSARASALRRLLHFLLDRAKQTVYGAYVSTRLVMTQMKLITAIDKFQKNS